MIQSSKSPADAEEAPLWRTVVSFLLFLQLFAVLVGVFSNETPSALERSLRNRVPGLRAYLELFLMDISHYYVLTYGASPEPTGDSQCWIEAELDLPDGSKKSVILPPTNNSSQRFKHYDSLARRSVLEAMTRNPTIEGILPHGVARALVAETGATGGTIKLRWRPLFMQPVS